MFNGKLKILINIIIIMTPIMLHSQSELLLEEFVKYGSKAPSSHNAKMWKVLIDKEKSTLDICIDSTKIIPKVDPMNREAWISIGAFYQNCAFIAHDYGYETFLYNKKDTVVISFKEMEQITDTIKYRRAIEARKTTRKKFKKEDIDFIINPLLNKYNNVFYVRNDTELFEDIVQLSKKANAIQINNWDKRKELAECINFKKNELEKMNLKNLGLNTFERLVFKYFVNENRFTNSSFIRKQYLENTNSLYDQCSGFLIITSKNQNQKDWIESGILLEKIWIYLTQMNIAVQPISQVLEEEPYYSELKNKLLKNGEIQMILRLGIL